MSIEEQFADCDDDALRERLIGFVNELKNGKPAKVIDMVLRSSAPDKWRAKVFIVAGVSDPSKPASASAPSAASPPSSVVSISSQQSSAPAAPAFDDHSSESKETKPKRSKKKKEKSEKKKKTKWDQSVDQERITSLDVIEGDDPKYSHQSPLLLLIFLLGAFSAAELYIIFPSLSSYIFTQAYANNSHAYLLYGFVAGGYNLGQIFAAPFMGLLYDYCRSIKLLLLFSSSMLALGNLFYIFAGSHVELLPIGRFFSGIGAANIFSSYAHITKISHGDDQRNSRLRNYGWLLYFANLCGAGIGALGTKIRNSTNAGDLTINKFTFPALFMVILFGILIIGQIIHIYQTRHDPLPAYHTQRIRDSDVDAGRVHLVTSSILTRDAIVLLTVYFVILSTFWMFLTCAIPFIQADNGFGWDIGSAYGFVAFIGAVMAITYTVLQFIDTSAIKTRMVAIATTLVAMGTCFLLQIYTEELPEWQLFIGGGLIAVGYSMSIVIVPPLFTAITGLQFEDVGYKIGWTFAAISLASGIAPILGAIIFNYQSMRILGLICFMGCLFALSLMVLVPRTETDDDSFGQTIIQQSSSDRERRKKKTEKTGLRESLLDSSW